MLKATVSSEAWLVFRCGHEYVFVHRETTEILAVTLSATAIHMFKKYNLSTEELAKQAAEWVFLVKRTSGTVDFSAAAEDLLEFYRYFVANERLQKRAC